MRYINLILTYLLSYYTFGCACMCFYLRCCVCTVVCVGVGCACLAGWSTVDVSPPRVDPASLVTEPYGISKSLQDMMGWRQAHAHAQRLEGRTAPIRIQEWGISHARPWEESSELVYTMYTTPNI